MTEKIKQFVENAEKIGSSVLILKSNESLFSKVLQDIMSEEKEIHIDKQLLGQFPGLKNDLSLMGKSVYEDNANIEKSRMGVSYADYGIASTGSVCINITQSDYNKLSLLPLISVVLIRSEK